MNVSQQVGGLQSIKQKKDAAEKAFKHVMKADFLF